MKTAILFDLDGTLVDTAPDLAGAMNHVLAQEGRPPLPLAAVRDLVGMGARVTIAKGLRETGPAPTEADLDRLMPVFLDYYAANIDRESQIFEGVLPALDRFKALGLPMGVATNKYEGLSVQLLKALKLDSYFGAVVGGDSLPVRKPDPAHLFETLRRIGGHRAQAVMVGDSATDLKAARAAGLPVVLVSFGYTDVPARDLGADVVIDHFDALEEAIAGLLPL